MTLKLLDKNDNELDSKSIDFPIEQMVVDINYHKDTKSIEFVLKNGNKTLVSVADLVAGLVSETDFNAAVEKLESSIKKITNKLDTIEEGAQVNVIEKISLNGEEIPITDKTVDIEITAENANNIFNWDGKSSDENPDNIALWQKIIDNALENGVSIVVVTRLNFTAINADNSSTILTIKKENIESLYSNTRLYFYGPVISVNRFVNNNGTYTDIRRLEARITKDKNSYTITKIDSPNQYTLPIYKYLSTELSESQLDTINFEPTHNMHPATKKYVDDEIQNKIDTAFKEVSTILDEINGEVV